MDSATIALKELYDTDESVWIFENVKLIREGKIELVDWEHIAEELEIMGKSQFREVYSKMKELFLHLLKWMFQEEYRTSSWETSIRKQRDDSNEIFRESKNLKNYANENFGKAYEAAVKFASSETGIPRNKFPKEPPFTLNEACEEEFWPEK